MLAHIVVTVLVVMSFEAPVRADDNYCFDGNKLQQEMIADQLICEKELKLTDPLIVYTCVFRKRGLLKKTEDNFDVVKMKKFYLSKIKNNAMKKKVEQGMIACESKDTAIATEGKETYYACMDNSITKICAKKV